MPADLFAAPGVAAHDRPFLRGQLSRLKEDGIGYSNLAYIVQVPTAIQAQETRVVEAHGDAHRDADKRQPLAVAGRPGVALLDRLRQREQNPFRFVAVVLMNSPCLIGDARLSVYHLAARVQQRGTDACARLPPGRRHDSAIVFPLHVVTAYIGAVREITRVLRGKSVHSAPHHRDRPPSGVAGGVVGADGNHVVAHQQRDTGGPAGRARGVARTARRSRPSHRFHSDVIAGRAVKPK